MSQIPRAILARVPTLIKDSATALRLHAQQIVALQAATGALLPGSWETVDLLHSWSNVPGYIPAQVRILQDGMSQLIGHIQGGTTSNGTVIGTLTAGFFNSTHAHAFTVNAVSGASSVTTTGSTSGSAASNGLADGSINGSSSSSGLPDGTTNGTSGTGPNTAGHTHGPGSYAVTNGSHSHSNGSFSVANGNHSHSAGSLTPSTQINYNTPTINLDTSGNLTISNVNGFVGVLSFSQLIPLVTA